MMRYSVLSLLGASAPAAAETCPDHSYLGNYPSHWSGEYAEEIQGIAHDDGHWFITQKDALWKISVESDLEPYRTIPGLPAPVPDSVDGAMRIGIDRDADAMKTAHDPDNERGEYDHFGDIDQLDGYVFVPVEGSQKEISQGTFLPPIVIPAPPPLVAVYAASDLSYLGSAVLTANEELGRYTSWIAARKVSGKLMIYSSYKEISDTYPVFEYEVNVDKIEAGETENAVTFNSNIELPGTPHLKTIQGGVFTPYGDLYIINGSGDKSVEEENGGIHLYGNGGDLIAESENSHGVGEFKYRYSPTVVSDFELRGEEPEGIDWWDRSQLLQSPGITGQLHAILLDNGVRILGIGEDDAAYIKHYDVFYDCKAELDSDSDGLNDLLEVEQYLTDPYNADTDGDGMSDGVEVEQGTDPLVPNQTPEADAGVDQILECSPGVQASLDGTGSSDPDGDTLSYTWTGDFDGGSASGPTPTVTFSASGSYEITLEVDDGYLGVDTDTVTVDVVDTTPPELTLTVTPDTLWPPNHRMKTIKVTAEIIDVCDAEAAVNLLSITSNEADNGFGDGDAPDDVQGAELGTDDREFQLRSERSGLGDGRAYVITYGATDAGGNESEKRMVTVSVPKNYP